MGKKLVRVVAGKAGDSAVSLFPAFAVFEAVGSEPHISQCRPDAHVTASRVQTDTEHYGHLECKRLPLPYLGLLE
jgi:hypothetical protein